MQWSHCPSSVEDFFRNVFTIQAVVDLRCIIDPVVFKILLWQSRTTSRIVYNSTPLPVGGGRRGEGWIVEGGDLFQATGLRLLIQSSLHVVCRPVDNFPLVSEKKKNPPNNRTYCNSIQHFTGKKRMLMFKAPGPLRPSIFLFITFKKCISCRIHVAHNISALSLFILWCSSVMEEC